METELVFWPDGTPLVPLFFCSFLSVLLVTSPAGASERSTHTEAVKEGIHSQEAFFVVVRRGAAARQGME